MTKMACMVCQWGQSVVLGKSLIWDCEPNLRASDLDLVNDVLSCEMILAKMSLERSSFLFRASHFCFYTSHLHWGSHVMQLGILHFLLNFASTSLT